MATVHSIDWEFPDFTEINPIHDWKNYVGDELATIWNSFTVEQRKILAENFQDLADNEEWE